MHQQRPGRSVENPLHELLDHAAHNFGLGFHRHVDIGSSLFGFRRCPFCSRVPIMVITVVYAIFRR